MRIRKIFTYLCTALLVLSLATPVQGRIKEKVVIFNSTSGHNHDGSTGGKLVYLPAIAITDVNVCASQVCQLALTAEEGDICVRSDEDKSYIHNGGIVEDMTDWTLLLSTGLVISVNGDIGAIINVERTTRLQTTISDSDSNYASSGAVVDYTASEISTHTSDASAHHSSTSDGLNITPVTVTTTGDIKINSNLTTSEILFGTSGDVNLFRFSADILQTNDEFRALKFSADGGAYVARPGSVIDCFGAVVNGDTNWRYTVDSNGSTFLGPGNTPSDVSISRTGPEQLTIADGSSGTMTNGLIVKGPLEAQTVGTNITYSSTTKYLVLSASSFVNDTSVPWIHTAGSSGVQKSIATGTPVHCSADIMLEDGVTITNLAIKGTTDIFVSTNTITGTLFRNSLTAGPGSGTEVAACTVPNGQTFCADGTITNPVVDKTNYKYGLNLRGSWGGGSATIFYTAIVTYTTTNVTQ